MSRVTRAGRDYLLQINNRNAALPAGAGAKQAEQKLLRDGMLKRRTGGGLRVTPAGRLALAQATEAGE